MGKTAKSPVVMDLQMQAPNGIEMFVDTDQAKDSDGWYYKPGDHVKIIGDKKVAKCAAGQTAFGIVKIGIHEVECPEGLTSTLIVRVIPLKPCRYILELTSDGEITAGVEVTQSASNANRVIAASAVAIAAGEASVTSAAANGSTTITGGILPQKIYGTALTGATGANKPVQVLV